ncbi:hypothetical protein BMF94_4852 [Rhodotorula taiwanensis]|uniref:F-box domain-containing protein n=1 Tax=Rhodotorula taiwanensis TaxID=741276 RepID=A0A2S5B5Q8_9BASI|nr:hypothetical protein BMF94_4852 [Rhodotorula taiwanensis]
MPSPSLPASVIRCILDRFDAECEGEYARIHKILTISRVCKAWKPVAEQVAFRHVDMQVGDDRPFSKRLQLHLWTTSAHASHLRELDVDVILSSDSQQRRIALASFASLLVSLSAYRDLSSNKAHGLDSLSTTFTFDGAAVNLAELRVVSTALRAFESLRHLQVRADVVEPDAEFEDAGIDVMERAMEERLESSEDGFLEVDSLQIGNETAFGDEEEPEISFAFARSSVQLTALKRLLLLNVTRIDLPSWWDRLNRLEELEITPTTYSASRAVLEALLPILPRLTSLKRFYLTSLKLLLPFISPYAASQAKLKDAFGAVPLSELLAAVPPQCSLFQIDHLIFEPPQTAAMPRLIMSQNVPLPRLATARLLLRSQSTGRATLTVKQETLCRMMDLDGVATWLRMQEPQMTMTPATDADHGAQ